VSTVKRQPLALGMFRWGPLPDTTDLFLFWGGPGDGLHLTKGENGPHKRVTHHTASGIHATVQDAQQAVDAFVAAYEETKHDD
jgi:hypothetical protein